MYMYVASFVWTRLWSDYMFWPSSLWNLPKAQCLSKSFLAVNHCHPHSIEALPGGRGVPCRLCLNFKTSCIGVYKSLLLIVGFAVTVPIWPGEVVSCREFILRAVATFWAMSLSEFTPAVPLYNLQLLLVIHMWLVKPCTTILTSTPKGYHRSLRGASMNIKSYLLLYQIGKRSWLAILFLDVSLNNTVNSLQKLSLPYKELLF